MGPPKYMFRVLSKPIGVGPTLWQKWYITEHVPDVVNTGVGVRGNLSQAFDDFTLQTKTPAESRETKLHDVQLSHFNELSGDNVFCAVYQTEFENYMNTENIKNVRGTSDMFDGKDYHPLAEWDVRIYELIQNYDPDNLGETPTPYALHVQNEPADEADYHDFYENEHLDLLHKVPGYRRSQRFKLIHKLMGAPEDVPRFLVIHEFEHLDALDGPELRHADASPNVHRVFGTAKAVNVRGFKSVYSQGYEKA